MIGKITVGKSFAGCLLYCLNDKIPQKDELQTVKDRAEIILFNKCGGNQKELIEQFNEVRYLNLRLAKPVMHITLSLAPGEHVSAGKLMDIAEDCAKEMGFENNQYLAVEHKDKDYQHVHIVANRIGFDLRTVSDSNSYKKVTNYCRKMEQKYDLKRVPNPRKYQSESERQLPRNNQRKDQLKTDIKECLARSNSYENFEALMKKKRYSIIKGRGISFIDDRKVKTKGSEVGYSLQTIQRILTLQKTGQIRSAGDIETQSNNNFSMPNQTKGGENKNDSSDLLDTLMTPEESRMMMDKEFFNKKRKKRKSRGL